MKVLRGEKKVLKIYGSDYSTEDGTCIRDYIHVNDLANAHVRALDYLTRKSNSLTVNLATGIGYSVLEVVRKVEELSSKKVNYICVDKRDGDPSSVISKTKYKKFPLNWKPVNSNMTTIINSVLNVYNL